MKRMVVGTDGSDSATTATRWAADLASRIGAEVIVMTGFVPTESELPPHRVATLLAEAEAQLEAWSEVARSTGAAVRTVVEQGDPRPGLLRVAEREGADLIVVGRVGRSEGPGLLHIGSVAEWLAHHADRPVATIGGEVASSTHCVVVGVDGSAGSNAAVRWIRTTFAGTEVRVVAVAVHEPIVEWTPADSEANWRRDVERQIEADVTATLDEVGLSVEGRVLTGSNTAELLLEAAGAEGAELIVVGARGLGGFTGLRVGGVALRILHDADRPVVLVPDGDGSTPA
jgi:nucleotide-binding universal stress UspA family protein